MDDGGLGGGEVAGVDAAGEEGPVGRAGAAGEAGPLWAAASAYRMIFVKRERRGEEETRTKGEEEGLRAEGCRATGHECSPQYCVHAIQCP